MSEIYWIVTLHNIKFVLSVMIVIGIFATIFLGVAYLFEREVGLESANITKIWFKSTFVVLFISSIVFVFIPGKHELNAIYGIGSVVDYVKNDTTKTIPDNAVKALDKFLLDNDK